MNYDKIYNSLIERAKGRKLKENTHRHHIIPRAFDGSDDDKNLVDLTPREHFIAHHLLWLISNDKRMAFAFMLMCNKRDKFAYITSHSYTAAVKACQKIRKRKQKLFVKFPPVPQDIRVTMLNAGVIARGTIVDLRLEDKVIDDRDRPLKIYFRRKKALKTDKFVYL